MSPREWKGLLPREHGSWAYIAGPQIAALIASPSPGAAALWSAGCLLLFCAFQAFAAALRQKETVSLSGTAVGALGAVLVIAAARSLPATLCSLVPGLLTAVLGIFWRRGRLRRQSVLEVLGILSLSVQGGAGLMLGGGSVAAGALLAVAATSYFLLSLIWVRVRLSSEVPGRTPILPTGWNTPVSLLLLTASAVVGVGMARSLVGFLPGIYLGRMLFPAPRCADGRLGIRGLGMQEAVTAAIFSIGLGLFLPR